MDQQDIVSDIGCTEFTLPHVSDQLSSEFEDHVQSQMREWPSHANADPSTLIGAHTRLPTSITTSIRGAANEPAEAWNRVVNAASRCVRDGIFNDKIIELRNNGETVRDR
ncbi:hypothetical protein I302_104774 [Kwoniella bestiolae CBS 10118]|uniref:Uncharacterized protein n=1 Tax=Kwoniella bestiolae CBS 10118 TaxID=1296100 RepID=A0A1B9FRT4_9TREE|nr:hypothetical protein I302_09157 [Kwoniella bestiolae CBS 10118]OCF21478.1 hypothetical protein I302_09157 [Kwoniella bestiolae CBS 10118]